MKRFYLVILAVLLVIAVYFYFSNNASTLNREFSDFAIQDTSQITKIFIADDKGNTALLEKQNDRSWKVNGRFKARQDGINVLMKTFKRIDVREPVPKSALNTVIRELAVKSTKVEIYTGDAKPEKVYYVGHATKSHYGTNMLLEINGEKSTVPYVTHVPGFFGYLSTRFFTDEDLWRHRGIFEFEPDAIASIEVRYLEKPENSFILTRNVDDSFVLEVIGSKEKTQSLDANAVDSYLDNYSSVHFEFVDRETPLESIDSVQQTPPLHTFIVTNTDGEKVTLETFYKPITDGTINELTGEPYEYNIDRLYGWINREDFVIMQWPTVDQLMAYPQDFQMSENVEN
ncbi:MAG: hypothetical protein RIE58_08990 [Vicingaceae bacterium]